MPRMSEEEYLQHLENFKKMELAKRKFREVYGLPADLANVAASAELCGNPKLMKEVFQKHAEQLRTGNTPEQKPKKDPFLEGFERGSRW